MTEIRLWMQLLNNRRLEAESATRILLLRKNHFHYPELSVRN
jgi:hypothetical protein